MALLLPTSRPTASALLEAIQPVREPLAELDLAEPRTAALLADVQGTILKPPGRTFARLCFLEIIDADLARRWLGSLHARLATVFRLNRQAEDAQQPAPALAPDERLAVSLHLTAAGLRRLGARRIAPAGVAFDEGQIEWIGGRILAGRAVHLLGDDPADWLAQPAHDYTRPIHALLAIAFEEPERAAAAALAATATPAHGVRLVVEEAGGRFHLPSGADAEHFGYRETLSWPRFVPTTRAGGELTPLRHVLCPAAPRADGTERFGAFTVFRKFEQDVAAFLRAADRMAARFFASPDAAGREQACAWIMGRFRDGTPLVSHRQPAGHATNRFDYNSDRGPAAGNLCPFHAHIRKMNPRGDHANPTGTPPSDLLPVRRAMTYGDRALVGDPARRILHVDALPAEPVGLLFLSHHRQIEDFETIIAEWANAGSFPHGTVASPDALIGQPRRTPRSTRIAIRGPDATRTIHVDRYVIPRGGAYFFTPPLSFFSDLAAGILPR
jgi:deferrochelatase/peroxidase EfeB